MPAGKAARADACLFPLPVQMVRYSSPLGPMILAADRQGLCGAWFADQKYLPDLPDLQTQSAQTEQYLQTARCWLDAYFAGQAPPLPASLPLVARGSAFRRRIWKLLLCIPYGSVTSYGALAARAAQSTGQTAMSARAVGGAVGHNPLSVLIPCHRVVGADGRLTGYAGGLERKVWLLRHEGACLTPCPLPPGP